MRTVCCVMLVNDREAMVQRAIRAWKGQTYEERYRVLLIFDTSFAQGFHAPPDSGIVHVFRPGGSPLTIGALRNNANRRTNAEIILHWDSDDWSHPNRVAEQVALLEASGKEAVGYRDMLFWKVCQWCWSGRQMFPWVPCDECKGKGGEAWLYTNRVPSYCLGTSLCYWREVWQRNPFADTSAGEDTLWLHGVNSAGFSSTQPVDVGHRPPWNSQLEDEHRGAPRMIASIHGANTYAKIEPRAEEWKRVPEWDDHCRKVMAL